MGVVERPVARKQKLCAFLPFTKCDDWLEEKDEEYHHRKIAISYYEAGKTLYEDMDEPKPFPLETFIKNYLKAAPIPVSCAALALGMFLDRQYTFEEQKEKHCNTAIAVKKHCHSGMAFYRGMSDPKVLSFRDFMLKYLGDFMLKYLGTVPINAQTYADAWHMLHKDFNKYMRES